MNSILSRLPLGEEKKFILNENGLWISEDKKFQWFMKPFADSGQKTNYAPKQNEYIALVEKARKFMLDGHASKVVISRMIELDLPSVEQQFPVVLFQRLEKMYPSAFVFLYPVSKGVFWLGASPELLLEKKNCFFKTVSLAGTRPAASPGNWGEKEIVEQKIVTDYILDLLVRHGGENVHTNGPYTSAAGVIEHLKTDILFESNQNSKYWMDLFHPTPAICGFPKMNALEFIQSNEFHNREMYSGVIGWHSPEQSHLYIQLRTMKVDLNEGKAYIYVGGGLLPESDSLLEWEETEKKAMVMKSVLF